MWILGRSGGASQSTFPGSYYVPRDYDVGRLAHLAHFLASASPKIGGVVVMTWKHADALETLARLGGDGESTEALWALHGEPGATLPYAAGALKLSIRDRFPSMKPRWVLVLDPEAPASTSGWFKAHVKMPLVSWLGRMLDDERHPLHVAGARGINAQDLGKLTSDPLELCEIVQATVEHRLSYAVSPVKADEEGLIPVSVNVEPGDWQRSVRVAAARRLAVRVNGIPEAVRGDAARVLFGVEVAEDRRERALDGLVRVGVLDEPGAEPEKRRALARTLLEDENARVLVRDALVLAEGDRTSITEETGPVRANDAVLRPTTAGVGSREPLTPERLEELQQAAQAPGASPVALAGFAEALQEAKVDPARSASLFRQAIEAAPEDAIVLAKYARSLAAQRDLDGAHKLYEQAILADPLNANNLGDYATFLCDERRDLDRAQEMYERALAADPENAINLASYALFLHYERRDLDRAQEMYERALAANPENAINLTSYALFLHSERRDLDRAQEMYERALAADPENAINLTSYALFLHNERRDLDRAQEMYERALAADPENAINPSNYAVFLHSERRNLDRAQEMYERAIAADSENANNLGNYALFLHYERRDLDRAQELYEHSLAMNPKNVPHLSNYAHLLFVTARSSEALNRLRETIKAASASPPLDADLACELAYYRAVHLSDERDDALRTLHTLVAQGARSPGWNFRGHAVLAEKAGDPDAPLFFALADVLSAGADPATLDAFPRWTRAALPAPAPP